MNSLTIPLKIEVMQKANKMNKIEKKREIKNRLIRYIYIVLKKNSLKGFDQFVETFSAKAKYRKIKKEYLVDVVCLLMGELLEERKRNGRGGDLPKHPPKGRIDV